MAAHQKVTDEQLIEAVAAHSTMNAAAKALGINLSSLKERAKRLGVYKPNPGRKGIKRDQDTHYTERSISLDEILQGLHPTYQTHKLRLRLIKAGIKEQKCEICGTSHWQGKLLSLILDHINGINDDHRLDNLRIICPNCDSQLSTFCGRNKGIGRRDETRTRMAEAVRF